MSYYWAGETEASVGKARMGKLTRGVERRKQELTKLIVTENRPFSTLL
jgi:hypothetical protein